MTHEDFVTFEQAKQLKQLGFDWGCNHWYHTDEEYEKKLIRTFDYANHSGLSPKALSAPTLSQVQKWLMDKKHIIISIRPNDFVNDSGNSEIHYVTDIFETSKNHLELLHSEAGYETYEFALEDGINDALNFLEKKE